MPINEDQRAKRFGVAIKILAQGLSADPSRLIIVVGEGVSVASANAPDWATLIRNLCDFAELKLDQNYTRSFRDMIQDGQNLVEAATQLRNNLSKGEFGFFLEDQFANLQSSPVDGTLYNILERLRLAGARIATTNYDTLIEDELKLGRMNWTSESLQRFFTGRNVEHDPRVLHLHGLYDGPRHVVFTSAEYRRIADRSEKDEAVVRLQHFLLDAFANSHILFVGCGDTTSDPHLSNLFDFGLLMQAGDKIRHVHLCTDAVYRRLGSTVNTIPTSVFLVPYGDHPHLGPSITRLFPTVFERKPLCFVLMPFGRKRDATGTVIDFDAVYRQLIAPAIQDARLVAVRGDEEMTGGIVHKAMFEHLILCEYAVADLTSANPNIFYQLGVRHAVRPSSTVLLFTSGTRMPFDVQLDRGLAYDLSAAGGPADTEATRNRLAKRLVAARDASIDSPVFQLIKGLKDIDRLTTGVFREQARHSEQWKQRLAQARADGIDSVHAAEHELGDLRNVESEILLDLFLSYRANKGYEEMIRLVERMAQPLARTPMVLEQLGLALNRVGRRTEAETVLLDLIRQGGPSSSTYGILGRIYKDRWAEALGAGETFLAKGMLDKAIEAYLKGFEADWRDTYPGINTVTLMEFRDPPDPRREQLIPVVTYANQRRLASREADYWDHATRLELAVLAKDKAGAEIALAQTLAMVRESWEPESTANNLKLIHEARERRGTAVSWAVGFEGELLRKAGAGAIITIH